MTYEVPAYRVEKLVKLVNRAINKGGKLFMSVGDSFYKSVNKIEYDEVSHTTYYHPVMVKYVNVVIDGEYKINGFDFVGTIEHTDGGNIIRTINSSYDRIIPDRYHHCGPECEHCHRIRNRKDTYLVHNDKTNEFKQVGKQCLMDYTMGITPETCEAYANVLHFADDSSISDDDMRDIFNGFDRECGYDNDEVKHIAIAIVKKFGYEKEGVSVNKLIACLYHPEYAEKKLGISSYASDEEVKVINDYADSVNEEYGYMGNAKTAWKMSVVTDRDLALICSFVSTYYKNAERLAKEKLASESTSYVGNIGDKVTINVASTRVLYTKHSEYGYHNYASSYVYEILDNNGNTFIWSTSKDLDDAKTIVAVVKEYSEFRGVKQTIVTRGKVIE